MRAQRGFRAGHRGRGSHGVILVAIGANLPGPAGSPRDACGAAVAALDALAFCRVVAVSRWIETAPEGPGADGPAYINGVVRLRVLPALASEPDGPGALLAALGAIETRFGRRRDRPNGARTLDLDLIDVDGIVRAGPDPILPHPRAAARGFVLGPIRDVAPEWTHPVLGLGVDALLARLDSGGLHAPDPATN